MGRRQSRPALLELLKSREEEASSPAADRDRTTVWPGPGRSIRITAGHLLVVATVVIILLVVTWMIAFRQGELKARSDLEPVIFQPVVSDPVLASPLVEQSPAPLEAAGENDPSAPVVGDPRQEGLFYFVLAETREAGALRLARFCRARGLETWVIPRDNTGLARVIALPGLTSTSRSEADCRNLDDRIGSIGLQWVESGGQSSLEDRYLVRWDG